MLFNLENMTLLELDEVRKIINEEFYKRLR